MFKKIIENVKNFMMEVRGETKKVTFPSKEDTIGTTTVVVVLVSMATIYMWLVDLILSSVITKILP